MFFERLSIFSDLSIFFERGGPQGARLPERPEGFKTTMGGLEGWTAKDSSPECWGWGKKLLDITQGILKGYSRDIKI